MKYQLKYVQYNENAILIQWPSEINENILSDILSFKQLIQNKISEHILYVNNAYNSLLIVYNNNFINFEEPVKVLKAIYSKPTDKIDFQPKLWKIPVCYDMSFGLDLEFSASEKQLSIADIVAKHASVLYTVYFIGFLPGFMYLGGLDTNLHMPRKEVPRQEVIKGAVAIGGKQTGIYPMTSPGGWHIIGNSPINYFDRSSDKPCFASAGDKVKFLAIDINEHHKIAKEIEQGTYELKYEHYND